MGIISGALLQGLGQGVTTVGMSMMKWQAELQELERRRQLMMEQISASGVETRKTDAAKLANESAAEEGRMRGNLGRTNPELLKRYEAATRGDEETVGVEDESGGHSTRRRVTLTPEQQREVDLARMSPTQRATVEGAERTASRQEAAEARRDRVTEEQLRQGWERLRIEDQRFRDQVAKIEKSTWAAEANAEITTTRVQYDKLSGQIKELQKTINDPAALPSAKDAAHSEMERVTGELKTLSDRLNEIGEEARARRTGNGAGPKNDPFQLRGLARGSGPNAQSAAARAAK